MAKTDTLGGTIATKVFKDTDLETTSGAPVPVKLSATTLYKIDFTSAASSGSVYFKAYDSAGDVTVGTTAPVLTFPVYNSAADDSVSFTTAGLAFASGLQITCDTTGGGTAGSTNPSDALTVVLYFS
jgi:hypothetical protein